MTCAAAAVHATTRSCRASVAAALALLSTAEGMRRWCLGLWNTQQRSPGLLVGSSLLGRGLGMARVSVDAARGLVDYAVGGDEASLVPRIQARVQAGAELGYEAGSCLVTLLAWRTASMDDERWQSLVHAHEVEIDMIRAALEEEEGRAG
jgi:hypothetical protein